MKKILLALLISLSVLLPASAQKTGRPADLAQQLYEAGLYNDALCAYQAMARTGQSARLYYNMGNCYYRMDSIAQALLWYERAYLLDPCDADIRYNLQLARTKTTDKVVPEEELFVVRWWRSLQNLLSVQGWTVTGIVLFCLALAGLCLFLFMSEVRWRKTGFYGALLLFVLMLLSNLFAWNQQSLQRRHDRAIVVSGAVSCKSSPNTAGKELFILHEGTSVRILDRSVKGWLQVALPDGKRCWMPQGSVEEI